MDTEPSANLETARFSVAGVLVEPDRNQISTPESTQNVERQVMVLLIYLAGRAGKVVSRSELLDALWPDTPTNDEALTQAVSKLRRALGDRGRQRRVIETVRKVGYRLAAPVVADPSMLYDNAERLPAAGRATKGSLPTPRPVRSAGHPAAWIAIAAVGVLSVANAAMLHSKPPVETPRVFMMRAALAAPDSADGWQPFSGLDGTPWQAVIARDSLQWQALGGFDSARLHTPNGIDTAKVATLLSRLAAQIQSSGGSGPGSGPGSGSRHGFESGDVTVRFKHVAGADHGGPPADE